MSVEYSLKGNRLSVGQWNNILAAWESQQDPPPYQEAKFEGDENHGYHAHLWRPGSTRGVLLDYGTSETRLRMNALASRIDWVIGFSVLRAAMEHGGGTLECETGEVEEDLSRERAIELATDNFCAMSRMLFPDGTDEGELPFGRFSVPISRELVPPCDPEEMPAIEKRLADRVESYASSGAVRSPSGFNVDLEAEDATTQLLEWCCDQGKAARPSTEVIEEMKENGLEQEIAMSVLGIADKVITDVLEGRSSNVAYQGLVEEYEVEPEVARMCVEGVARSIGSGQVVEFDGSLWYAAADHEFDLTQLDDMVRLVRDMVRQIRMGVHHSKVIGDLIVVTQDQEAADGLYNAIAVVVQHIGEKKSAQETLAGLTSQGLSEPVAAAVMKGVADGIRDES